jgi:hypothetical protein
LDIFYSYIQHFHHSPIKIVFFLMMEHVSFLPPSIYAVCHHLSIGRPSKTLYKRMIEETYREKEGGVENAIKINRILDVVSLNEIMNIKELRGFVHISQTHEIPKDIFNIICDTIIREMSVPSTISFTHFRDLLYDILTYNLDMTECLWYILTHFIERGLLTPEDVSLLLDKSFFFLKHYNNNYRPIYHIESILFYIINKVHRFTPPQPI